MSMDLHPSGIPFHIIQYDSPKVPGGAMYPGADFSIVDTMDMGRWVMELVCFSTRDKVKGLLIWEHYRSPRQLISKEMAFQPPPTGELYFFGYKCQRCKSIYLVPDSIKSVDDLPAAMWHECKESEHGR